MTITAGLLDKYLHHYFLQGYKYQISNSFIFMWESDFFAIAKSGYSYEVEVKVSRSDFFADFNKEQKHRILSHEDEIYTFRSYVNKVNPLNWSDEALRKWRDPDEYCRNPRSRIAFKEVNKMRPNKFVFAVPDGLVEPEEIPDYAGLMYINTDSDSISKRKCRYIKQPPPIHCEKNDFTEVLIDKYYWFYRNHRKLPKTKTEESFDQIKEYSA